MSKTMIYAHRGANKEAAENTRTAFDKALHYAIDGIETDIQISRDGVAVLWHDDDLAKLGLRDKRIDDFDHEQLREMDLAAHFAGAAKEGVDELAGVRLGLPQPLSSVAGDQELSRRAGGTAAAQGATDAGIGRCCRWRPCHGLFLRSGQPGLCTEHRARSFRWCSIWSRSITPISHNAP